MPLANVISSHTSAANSDATHGYADRRWDLWPYLVVAVRAVYMTVRALRGPAHDDNRFDGGLWLRVRLTDDEAG